jgi:hypothetical protein
VWKMEPPHLNRPVTRDRGISESFAMRPRAGSEIDPAASRLSTRGTDENRSPATLPRAFESMLKTTTETGDIGMFSIKPSRVPQSTGTPRRMGAGYNENGLQKSRQTFQSFGVPNVDDRRRLPSYSRDATSEVISMYETASQKSASRVFDDADYRSYSMTQTSYSAYTLSNHRSYASLRSQQDGNGLLQRPRSPFAYPARLKRPGFRPSSLALTDGGVVDYSRRAEIDRTTYVSCPARRLSLTILSATDLEVRHKSLRQNYREFIILLRRRLCTLKSESLPCPSDRKQTDPRLLFSANRHLRAVLQALAYDKVTET